MRSLGQNPAKQEFEEMISLNGNGYGAIDFEQFLQLMKSRCYGNYLSPEEEVEEELRQALARVHRDGNGSPSISRDELKLIMLNANEANLTENEIDEMMVSFDRFMSFFMPYFLLSNRILLLSIELEKLVMKNLKLF